MQRLRCCQARPTASYLVERCLHQLPVLQYSKTSLYLKKKKNKEKIISSYYKRYSSAYCSDTFISSLPALRCFFFFYWFLFIKTAERIPRTKRGSSAVSLFTFSRTSIFFRKWLWRPAASRNSWAVGDRSTVGVAGVLSMCVARMYRIAFGRVCAIWFRLNQHFALHEITFFYRRYYTVYAKQ